MRFTRPVRGAGRRRGHRVDRDRRRSRRRRRARPAAARSDRDLRRREGARPRPGPWSRDPLTSRPVGKTRRYPYTGRPWGRLDPCSGCACIAARSARRRQHGRRGVAQLVAQRSPKPQVAGSSPVAPAGSGARGAAGRCIGSSWRASPRRMSAWTKQCAAQHRRPRQIPRIRKRAKWPRASGAARTPSTSSLDEALDDAADDDALDQDDFDDVDDDATPTRRRRSG